MADEVGGVATGENCAAPLDDDAVAVDYLDFGLGRKKVPASQVDEHLPAQCEFTAIAAVNAL